eukprot:s1080_g31.t2
MSGRVNSCGNAASASTTTVAFLDSLYSTSCESRQETVVKKLCEYLECEWRVCGAVGTFQASRVQAVAVDVPQQTNNFDCGIYVLEFVLQLLQHPWRLAALGQRKVTFQVCADAPRRRWHDAAMKLRDMKKAAPAAGVESAWFAARLWLQELQKDGLMGSVGDSWETRGRLVGDSWSPEAAHGQNWICGRKISGPQLHCVHCMTFSTSTTSTTGAVHTIPLRSVQRCAVHVWKYLEHRGTLKTVHH